MRAFTPTAKCEKRTEIVDGRARKSYGHRKPLEEWEVLLKDHHEGYIDWAEFERNQQQLAVNAYGKVGGVKSGRGGRALLVGVVEVRARRFGPCRCGVASRRTITPAAEIMPDRCTPEYERTLAKMGALLPYRRARSLLEEFLPLGCAPKVETIRQRTMHVGARLEHEAVAPPTSSPSSEAGSIALAIDGGHVKSVRSYHVRSSSSPRSPTTPASGSCSAADHHLIVINLNATFTKVFLTGVLSCRDTRSGISNGQIRLFCRRRL